MSLPETEDPVTSQVLSANEHLLKRLEGLQDLLMSAHRSSSGASSATKGRERETFVDGFLRAVLPPQFRFGSGEVTDLNGKLSGQLDVVVEYSFQPSLPVFPGSHSRLYLAEGVVAAIEVKSNIQAQWDDVCSTANKLHPLSRPKFFVDGTYDVNPTPHVPLFAVGYHGWYSARGVHSALTRKPVAGILVIKKGLFVSGEEYGGLSLSGPWALWGFAC